MQRVSYVGYDNISFRFARLRKLDSRQGRELTKKRERERERNFKYFNLRMHFLATKKSANVS